MFFGRFSGCSQPFHAMILTRLLQSSTSIFSHGYKYYPMCFICDHLKNNDFIHTFLLYIYIPNSLPCFHLVVQWIASVGKYIKYYLFLQCIISVLGRFEHSCSSLMGLGGLGDKLVLGCNY